MLVWEKCGEVRAWGGQGVSNKKDGETFVEGEPSFVYAVSKTVG